jgi:predicted DNA-binding transcriptional regulator AlpA
MIIGTEEIGARLLSPEEAARKLGLRLGTLANRRSLGLGPAYIKLGRAVRYREEDLETFIEQHRVVVGGQR